MPAVSRPILSSPPTGRDGCTAVAVAPDGDRAWVKQRDRPLGWPPAWQPAATYAPPAGAWVLAAQPADHPPPAERVQVGERLAGGPVPEIVGPAAQHPVQPVQHDRQRLVGGLSGDRPHLRLDGRKGLAGRVGVDVVPRAASLLVALDAPAEEVEALLDVTDGGLLLRQPQPHRGQHRRDLLTQRLGVLPGAGHQHHEVIRIPHDPVVGQSLASSPFPHPRRGAGLPVLDDVLIQHRQGQVAEQRGKNPTLRGAGDRVPDRAILAEDARLQERLDQRQDPPISDPSPHSL
jgi:hypothetical protein